MDIQRLIRKKEKAKAEGNLNSLFGCCKELADVYFRQENYDKALREYEELLQVSECLGNKLDIARAHRMIGEVHCAKDEFDDAIKHQLIHLGTSCEEGDVVEEQRALATLGRTHFLMSETLGSPCSLKSEALKQANSYYMKSLAVCEKLRDEDVGHKQRMEMRARLFLNLGLVYDSQGCYEKAVDDLSKAIMICKKLDLYEDLYRTYAALASVYHHHGDNKNSIANYDMAMSVASRLSDKVDLLCECSLQKAEVLLNLPDFRGARQVLLKAYKSKASNKSTREEVERKLRIVAAMCECEDKLLDLAAGENYRDRKKLYESIGDMGVALSNYDLALTYYHLMLECVEKSGNDRQELIESYVSLSQTYRDNKNYDKAIEFFKKQLHLEKENPSEACKTCLNIADCLEKLCHFDRMIEYYDNAKQYASKANNQKLEKTVERFKREALISSGQLPPSVEMDLEVEELGEDEESSCPDDGANEDDFGAHINLDTLTDEEGGDSEEFDRPKATRSRNKSVSLMKRNEKGETPLHTACISGNKNLVKKLLEQGHSVDVKDFSGWTPLHEACNHGFRDIVCLLLDHGAPINDRGGRMCDGVTPLLDAASNGCLDVVETLLERGASPLMRNNKGESVIDCLSAWRQRYISDLKTDLDSVSLAHYCSLYDRLKLSLEKAGQKVSQAGPSEERIISRTRRPTPEKSVLDAPRSLEYKRLSECRKSPAVGAATEYETAMKALRHRYKPDKISSIAKVSVPALLKDTDDVGDDWLENDLQPQLKKRKTSSRDVYTTGLTIRNRAVSPPSSPCIDDSEESNDSTGKVAAEQDMMTSSPTRFDNEAPSVSGSSSNRLKVMNTTRKKQISLMTTGVTKEKVRRSNERTEPCEDVSNSSSETSASRSSPLSSCDVVLPSEAPTATQPRMGGTIVARLKVRIEGKLFLIAVPNSSSGEPLTVKWLAEQAVKRYYNLEGVEPVIHLTTDDGALLDETDPIEILFSCSEIVGQVQSWKMDTIGDRYSQACKKSKTCEVPYLVNVLEACQATSEVMLDDQFLTHSQLEPVLKALSCHLPLRILGLSGNKLSDQTFKVVIECIEKLPYLEHLDISNTNLSASRLNLLAESVRKSGALKNLQKLFLGYNPLKDSVKSLTSLLEYLPSLTKLSLVSIGLNHKYFRFPSYFTLDRIECLDVSDNDLGLEGVSAVLSRLEPRTLCHITMRHIGPSAVQELALFLQQFQPPSLSFIDLSYCSPSAEQLHQLIKGIEVTPKLETLRLDGASITNETLQTLLNLDLARLSLGGSEISEDITTQIKSLAITSCSKQSRGNPGPFGCYIDSF